MRRWVDSYALPFALALVWVVSAAFEYFETPSLAAEFAAVVIVALLIRWAFLRRTPSKTMLVMLAICALPVGVMFLAAARSQDPRVALVGGAPLHQGWLLWAVLLAWLAAAMIGGERRDLRRVTLTLAALGTASGVWALLQFVGLLPRLVADVSAPAAFADNPLSLAQMLIVTVSATLAALANKPLSKLRRDILIGALAVQLAALYITHARASFIAVVFGLMVFGLTSRPREGRSRVVRALAAVALIAFIVAFALAFAASVGMLGPTAYGQANLVLSGRPEIWTSAVQDFLANPWFGVGPSHFSDETRWQVAENGSIAVAFAYDAHSILVDWLLGAGIAGFIAFGIAAIAVGRRLARAIPEFDYAPALRWLAAGGAALLVAMFSSWPDPIAALSATAIVGILLGVEIRHSEPEIVTQPAPSLPVSVAAVAISVGAIVLLWPSISGQYVSVANSVGMLPNLESRLATTASRTGDSHWLQDEALLVDTSGLVPRSTVMKLFRDAMSGEAQGENWDESLPVFVVDSLWENRVVLTKTELWSMTQRVVSLVPDHEASQPLWLFLIARAAVSSGRPDAAIYVRRFDASPHDPLADTALQYLASAH